MQITTSVKPPAQPSLASPPFGNGLRANRLKTTKQGGKLVNDYWADLFAAKDDGRKVVWYNGTYIPPFDHPHVMAGQGTAAKELIEEVGPLDLLLVPTSGGGLLSGCAVAARALSPDCRIVGIEPEAANDAQQSLRSGTIVRIDAPRTIADGAQSRAVGQLTFPVMRRLVDDIETVSDAELVDTMRFFASRMKILVEPTGCLAAAAALSGRLDLRGKRVGIIVTGGNIDLDRFATLVQAA